MPDTKKGGITSTAAKLIAIALMLIDHTAVVFEAQLTASDAGAAVYEIMRTSARIAFPLFAFFIAVGAVYTSNILKYMLRLLLFAFISEVPFDLAFNGAVFETGYQNVFFTLFLGLLSIFLYKKLRELHLEPVAFLLLFGIAYAAEELLKTDYGAMGVICIFLFYVFLQTKAPYKQMGLVLTCLLVSLMLAFNPYTVPLTYRITPDLTFSLPRLHMDVSLTFNYAEFFAVAAAPFILLFNGSKGRKINRWFFYVFYPAHLALLAGVHWALFH